MTKGQSSPVTPELAAVLRGEFLSFAKKAFDTIQSKELRLLAHLELIVAALLEVHEGRTNRLIINQPPRTMKSLLVVFYIAWLLGKRPGQVIALISHDETLAQGHVDKVREIVESDWYRQVFPKADTRSAFSRHGHFRLGDGGEVLARSFNTGLTGHGFDLVVIDDPMDAGDAESDAARQEVIRIFDDKITSRLDSQKSGKIIVASQRLHMEDLCGHLAQEPGWTRLVVPLVAREALLHTAGSFSWSRPAGHILDPEIYPPEWIENERQLRQRKFVTQYQQEPEAARGGVIKPEWFDYYSTRPPSAHRVTMSIDCAQYAGETSSFSCFVVMATDGVQHYVVDVVRKKLEFPGLVDQAHELVQRHRPTTILVEDAALGTSLISQLRREGVAITAVKRPTKSKLFRLEAHVDVFYSRKILVPQEAMFARAFMKEFCTLQEGGYSDQVDCATQYLDWFYDPDRPAYQPVVLGARRGGGGAQFFTGGGSRAPSARQPHAMRHPGAMRPRRF